MYRYIRPEARPDLSLRMLFQPAGVPGIFHRACEADTFRGLVAALLDDPGYEQADVASRLERRLRLAEEFKLLAQLANRDLSVGDSDGPGVIDISSDEHLIRALNRAQMVSFSPSHAQP